MPRAAPLPMHPNRLFARVMEWLNAPAYRLACKLVDPQPENHVLEIGFGSGRLLEMIAQKVDGIHLAGVDPTETMVRMASARPALRKLGNRLDLRSGTAQSLPWRDKTFDMALAVHCFQFWEDPDVCIQEIIRVLKPGGRLVLLLRSHEKRAPNWLPNPISRSGNEYQQTIALLRKTAFGLVEEAGRAGSTRSITAWLTALPANTTSE